MDTKHVFLASNDCENTEIVTISRQLTNKQRIEVDCPKAIMDYKTNLCMELTDSIKEYPPTRLIESLKRTSFAFSFSYSVHL